MRFFILRILKLGARLHCLATFLLAATVLCTFSACALFVDSPATETLTITLPAWPPDDALASHYPPLSRWYILIARGEAGENSLQSFYTTDTEVTLAAKKNRPFCLIAQPVTRLSDGNESAYFKPAGYLYTAPEKAATWEQGFLADIMKTLFCEGLSESLSPVEVEYIVSTFNWKKAQESIDKKISQGTLQSGTQTSNLFYNPWLVSKTPLLQGIAGQSFKATLLNAGGTAGLDVTAILGKQNAENSSPQLLSSFIPENSYFAGKNQLTILKNTPTLLADGHKYGIFITYKSAKNISLEFIYMPIYIEDI